MPISTYSRVARNPACARCGGSGYVYLWSIDRDGSVAWFCDRGACKHFWSDAAPAVAAAGIEHGVPA